MSTVVGQSYRIHHGNEVSYDITCCMAAVSEQNMLIKTHDALHALNDIINPTHTAHMQVIYPPKADLTWKFCPVCGDRLKESGD